MIMDILGPGPDLADEPAALTSPARDCVLLDAGAEFVAATVDPGDSKLVLLLLS
jgi:hypothetical protein